jgi:hypothetical protein
MLADYNENSSGGGNGGKLHPDVPRYAGLSTGSGPYLHLGSKGPGGAPELEMPKQGGGLAVF